MKPSIFRTLAATTAVVGALLVAPSQAASKQYVVVVSEGLSPQILDLGKGYLRKADDDPEAATAFDTLMAAGKAAPMGTDALAGMQGLLETAENNGYKTGLVTTGDISTVAPLFYTFTGDAATALAAPDAKYDFLAGGGRAKFAAKLPAAGLTYVTNPEGFEGELTGRVLALQTDGEMDYSLDRDPLAQIGLAELSAIAMDTLGAGDSPFVLVVHDTLAKRALDTKDSPALFAQFRELNTVVADIAARREDNPNFAAAVVMTGGAVTPRFTTSAQSEQDNSYFILSNLGGSFAGAGKRLQGANAAAITAFADPTEGSYRGWKVTPEVSSQIIAGALNPETAIRASYEPVLKLEYAAQTAAPVAYTLGFDASQGLAAALSAAVSKRAK